MSVTFAQGFSAAGVAAGISSVEGKKDLALVVNNGPLDSGGANACTGEAGYAQSVTTAETVAGLIGAEPNDVAVCSTGLIGELLPLDNVLAGAKSAHEALAATAEAGTDASHAIMTTDTKPKTVELTGSNGWKIGGMVKGSGMIAPQLATMLCVITTDAVVSAGQMQAALAVAAEHSFNRIDVDGCMSTNDTVPPDHRRRRRCLPRHPYHRHRCHQRRRGTCLWSCRRRLEPAQVRHLRQRSELGPHRQLLGHGAA